MAKGYHLGSPQRDKAPRTCGNLSPDFPAEKLDAGREAARALEARCRHNATAAPRGFEPASARCRVGSAPARLLWPLDRLGFEPRAFRMRSGCDATAACAPEHGRASNDM